MYRDDQIAMLDTKVSDGIWKGLYTTEERAESVVELEKYLNSITDQNDYVLCLDWVSFGYIMINGKMCSPTTLDASHYSYYVNNPNPYYMFFSVENRVPTKIIYIDYGRDEKLSIDDPSWKFNEFVNGYYHFEDEFANNLFTVKEYIINNYNGALKMVKEKAYFE